MGIEQRRQAGRPTVTTKEAARIMGRSARTVCRMIEVGELQGGAEMRAERRRWYVYSDQPELTAPARAEVSAAEPGARAAAELTEALRSENLDLRVQIAAANETTQLVMAAQAATVEAAKQYRTSMVEALAAADGYRDAADHWRRAAEGFQSSADSLFDVLDQYRDAVSQHSTPGHPG